MTLHSLRRAGAALLVACTLAAPAFAQAPAAKPPSPEHVALARAVLDFTGARRSFDNVVPRLLTDARNMFLRTQPNLQADLDASIVDVGKRFANADEDLVSKIALVYASRFTEEELRAIASFYQSPAGKKMTAELPNVLNASYQLVQDWSRTLSLALMDSLRADMKRKGHDL